MPGRNLASYKPDSDLGKDDYSADPAALVMFVQDLRVLLRDAVQVHGFLPEELLGDFQDAWKADASRDLKQLKRGVSDPSPETRAGLEAHRLTGSSLRLKIRGFFRSVREFARNPGRQTLRRALDWADIPLESLAAFMPPAKALVEFKKCVRQGLDES